MLASMPPSPSHAKILAHALAKLAPYEARAIVLQLPIRDVEWAPCDTLSAGEDGAIEHVQGWIPILRTTLKTPPGSALVAIEGICRVTLVVGGERFTAVVVHVIADNEPARTVILPLE